MPTPVALVTGASSGLGEQFARLFAKDGHSVVLVARSQGRLEHLAEELERLHKVKAHVVPVDLTQPGAPELIEAKVRSLDVEVEWLVNNAGFGSNGPFLDLERANEVGMVQVNCTALLDLTHRFGRGMRERKKGRILNIASTAGFQPGPFMATYYATKAFVVSFTEALAHELQGTGVTATCSCPGATQTEFGARSGNGESMLFKQPGIPSAADVAHHAYDAMMQGEVLSVHGPMNWLGVEALRFAPRRWVRGLAAALNRR